MIGSIKMCDNSHGFLNGYGKEANEKPRIL